MMIQAQQTQRRKSSNNTNVSDDLQLAISKMLPTINFGGVDVKPQVRDICLLPTTLPTSASFSPSINNPSLQNPLM